MSILIRSHSKSGTTENIIRLNELIDVELKDNGIILTDSDDQIVVITGEEFQNLLDSLCEKRTAMSA